MIKWLYLILLVVSSSIGGQLIAYGIREDEYSDLLEGVAIILLALAVTFSRYVK